MSRQNYYSGRKLRQKRRVDAGIVLTLTRRERAIQARLGGRKVLRLISGKLAESGVSLGRDRYFDLLRANGMLVKRKPCKPKTTNSQHSLPVFRNLISGIKPAMPNRIWVSDLTYIDTDEGFMYASLITDAGSRKIVGSNIGDSLEAEESSILALGKALKALPKDAHPIHHSDRGSQYCCRKYVKRLKKRGMKISMTEVFHCYENALAERVNGILKQEYEMDGRFRTKEQAASAFEQAVFLYNNRRPHMGIGYQIPAEFHSRGENENATARLRLAPSSALRAAPSGTDSALRSRSWEGGKREESSLPNAQLFKEINHSFNNSNFKLKCQI
ncbi:MAG: IS3 family transposase [Victivallales bacterium]